MPRTFDVHQQISPPPLTRFHDLYFTFVKSHSFESTKLHDCPPHRALSPLISPSGLDA